MQGQDHCGTRGLRWSRRQARRANARFLPPLIEPDVRISRIRLSDHLLPLACAAALPDDSPSPPSDTIGSVHEGHGSPTSHEPFAKDIDVCAGAITAFRSVPPNRSCETSGCCCRPESTYTTHSEPGSASG